MAGRNVWGTKRNRWGGQSSEGGGQTIQWGQIAGTLADQTDLAAALNGKADKTALVTTIPSDGNFNPNCLYVLDMSGTATLVMGLNAAAEGLAAKYHIFFKIGTTAPTITWPSLKGWADGEAPTIAASETAGYMHVYEVDFMEGYGYCKDWGEVQDA